MKTSVKSFIGILSLCISFPTLAAPLVIDHTSVALYTNLTASDIARVKTMWVDILGQSHSLGYRVGCQLLQSNVDNRFQVNVVESGPPESFTTDHLRISRAYRGFAFNSWDYGGSEAIWYTSPAAVEALKGHLSYCNTNGLEIAVFGLGWSWYVSWHNLPGGGIDPVYQVQWAGASEGGPDGDLRWGLDAEDYALTGNRVCMDTYLEATEQYRGYCKSNGYPTKVIFTTAPVDYYGDAAYQVYLKNNHIRSYVSNTTDGILFDYADILCWDDFGNRQTNAWTDLAGRPKFYEWVADDNYRDFDGSVGTASYHLGQRGALRLGKALWVMLAQMSAPASPPPAPVLHVSGGTAGVVQLQFAATSNAVYEVQFNSDLTSGPWQILTNISSAPIERTIVVEDSTSSTNISRFYRVAARPAP